MKLRIVLSVGMLCASSAPAFAGVNFEVGSTASTYKFSESVSNQDATVKSSGIDVSAGYTLKSFPLAFGLLISSKTYDTSELSEKNYSRVARTFYEDPSLFASPADVTEANIEGSWKGLMYGPQFLLSFGFKTFDPYLKGSYQVGTLKSTVDYTSTGSYLNAPVAYDFALESDQKASMARVGLGLRVRFTSFYFFGEFGIESLKLTSENESFESRSVYNGQEQTVSDTQSASSTFDGQGQAFSGGIGLAF